MYTLHVYSFFKNKQITKKKICLKAVCDYINKRKDFTKNDIFYCYHIMKRKFKL